MDDHVNPPLLIGAIAIIGWAVSSMVRAVMHARVRELEVRERIAMIERGLVPPPEKDPQGFDRAMGRYDRLRDRYDDRRRGHRSPHRYRSGAVMMVGVGVGVFLLIGVDSGNFKQAASVGGFMVIIGLAMFINSLLERGRDEGPNPGSPPYPPPMAGAPPQGSHSEGGGQPPSFGAGEPRRPS